MPCRKANVSIWATSAVSVPWPTDWVATRPKNTAYITKLRVCFTPNTKLKKAMSLDNKAFTLERVDFLPEEEDREEEGDI